MIKKQGSIIPKYLVKSLEKKAQHIVKFGCDVEIKGRSIKALTVGVIISIPQIKYVNKKKRQRLVKGFVVRDIYAEGIGNSSAVDS
jgi:hypothetical protein